MGDLLGAGTRLRGEPSTVPSRPGYQVSLSNRDTSSDTLAHAGRCGASHWRDEAGRSICGHADQACDPAAGLQANAVAVIAGNSCRQHALYVWLDRW